MFDYQSIFLFLLINAFIFFHPAATTTTMDMFVVAVNTDTEPNTLHWIRHRQHCSSPSPCMLHSSRSKHVLINTSASMSSSKGYRTQSRPSSKEEEKEPNRESVTEKIWEMNKFVWTSGLKEESNPLTQYFYDFMKLWISVLELLLLQSVAWTWWWDEKRIKKSNGRGHAGHEEQRETLFIFKIN